MSVLDHSILDSSILDTTHFADSKIKKTVSVIDKDTEYNCGQYVSEYAVKDSHDNSSNWKSFYEDKYNRKPAANPISLMSELSEMLVRI